MLAIAVVVCCTVLPATAALVVGVINVMGEERKRAVQARWAALNERIGRSIRGAAR